MGCTSNPRELLKLGFGLSQAAVGKYMERSSKAAFSYAADISTEPCEGFGCRRLLRGSNSSLRLLVCLSDPVTRPSSRGSRRCDRIPDDRMGGSTIVGSLLVEQRAPTSVARSGWKLRRMVCEAANCLGIREVLTAPQLPWQNAYVERLIGSIRRECLDHVIILNGTGLRRVLKSYFDYYERSRTTCRWARTRPSVDRFNLWRWVASWIFHKLADSIIATNGSPPEWALATGFGSLQKPK
jgi:hypothetical protein